jgi:dTDP-4-amino-4,6-dideoxygalactose transaminase
MNGLRQIPFNKASFSGRELQLLGDTIVAGHVSGGGAMTRVAEELLASLHGGLPALLTTSCTHSLELAALLLALEPGDEVIVPAYTFVSTAAAFLLHGARPVFVDVLPNTLNIDPAAVEAAITPRTRAVCFVNYAGIGADFGALMALAARHELRLVEDNAHGLGGSRAGRTLGTSSTMSTLSFHETKNVTCGEGGALVIQDEMLLERAEILREKGTNRARFFRGQVDKYTWVDVGSSWVLSDLLAGILVGQLERLDAIQARRQAIWDRYASELSDWAEANDVRLPVVPDDAVHTAHLFHLRLPDLQSRTQFINRLAAAGVHTAFHYQSLHLSDVGRQLGGRQGQHPVTEEASDTLVRLPLFASLNDDDQTYVLETITSRDTGLAGLR